jgi:4-amino-4-deoxy-L-arabinose transferase-like glycosyltransferase
MRNPTSILKETGKAPNVILIVFNILAFVFLSVFWFWYLGSQEIYKVIDQKAHTINNISREDPNFNLLMEKYISDTKANTQKIQNVTNMVKQRNNDNIDLFINYLIPPLAVLVFFLILSLIYLGYSNERWEISDTILLVLLLVSFVVEVIFYIVVIHDFQFVPDSEIIANILKS